MHPVRRFAKRFLHRDLLRNAKVWLTILIAANVAYVGVGFTSQGVRPVPAPASSAAEMPGLRLVSEMTVAQELETVVTEPVEQLVCQLWGPFNNVDDLAELQSSVAAAGGTSEIRESVVANDPDYLVYVGRPGEAENARRTLQELKSQSIDSALIVRGPYNNTLSVGVFSRSDRANAQKQRVAKLGYEVGIEEIDRSYEVFHLEAQVPADFSADPAPNGSCADIAQAH